MPWCHSTAFCTVYGKLNPFYGNNQIADKITYSVEPVVDEMFQIFAHSDLSHQLVLVAVHACQLSHMSKDVLQSIRQLQYRSKIMGLIKFEITDKLS